MHAEPYTTSATAHARHAQNSKEKSSMLNNAKRPGPGWIQESHWKLKKRTLKPQTCRTPMPSSVSRAPERQIVDQSRFQESHWRLKKRILTPILKPKNATASPAETLHSVNTSYNPIRPGHKRSRTPSNITSQQAVVAPENAETPQSQASEDEVDHAHATEPS